MSLKKNADMKMFFREFFFLGIVLLVSSFDNLSKTVSVTKDSSKSSQMMCVERDSLALIALYNATGGDSWDNKTNWLSDKPIGEWFGVTTNEDGCVTCLQLDGNTTCGEDAYGGGNNLDGTIPKEIGDLLNLESLDLSTNDLEKEIPIEIGKLSNLKYLDFLGNDLVGKIPDEIGNLSNLIHLDLAFNNFESSIPKEIGNLNSLEFLDLSYSEVVGSIPSTIGLLTNLKNLDLVNNELTGSIPEEMGTLQNLEELSLASNGLSGEIPTEIGKLSKLQKLFLHNNSLEGLIPSQIGGLISLEKLNFSNNNLTGQIPSEIGQLVDVIELDLADNELEGRIPSEIGQLQVLEELDLQTNKLIGTLPAIIGNLKALKVLRVHNNELADNLPVELAGLDELIRISIQNNNFTFEDILPVSEFINSLWSKDYSPQPNIFPDTTIIINTGERLEIDLQIDEGVSTNIYYWLKDGLSFGEYFQINEGDNKLIIAQTEAKHSGVYKVEIKNSLVPNLTLYSGEIEIIVQPKEGEPELLFSKQDDFSFIGDQLTVDIKAFNFKNIKTAKFDIEWDETIMEYVNIKNITSIIPNLNENNFTYSSNEKGKLSVEWDEDAITLEDTVTLFSIIFQGINSYQTDLVFSNYNFQDDSVQNLGLSFQEEYIYIFENCRQRDSLALIDFYQKADGENWYDSDKWNFNAPMDTWEGISLNNSGCVESMVVTFLREGDKEKRLSSNLQYLQALRILDLTYGNFEGTFPKEIGKLENLETLDISSDGDNGFSGEFRLDMGGLKKLETLDVGYNKFSGSLPIELGELNSLRRISVRRNSFEDKIPIELGKLKNLEILDLSYNNFSNQIPNELNTLISLKTLNLRNNQLSGNPTGGLGDLINLEFLDLGENEFSGNLQEEIGALEKLGYLSFNNNNFTGSIPENWSNLQSLKTLRGSHNLLTGVLPEWLRTLSDLETIHLDNNQLHGNIPHFNNLKLGTLALDGNNFSFCPDFNNIDVNTWTTRCDELPQLGLNISNNKLSFDDILPNERINGNYMYCGPIVVYSPQDTFFVDTLIKVQIGQSIEIDLGIDHLITDNQYNWFKDGQAYTTIVGNPKLIFSDIKQSDIGIYRVEVTNPAITDLTLYSRSITIEEKLACNIQDSLALVALYNSTDGDSWTNNENWLLDKPINEWRGVETNEEGCATRLVLWDNNLNGTLPEELGDLLNLEQLLLSRNKLNGEIPKTLGKLENLRHLRLENNLLTGCFPIELLNHCNLQSTSIYNYGATSYYFENNDKLPWRGDLEKYCNGSPQIGAPCEDGNSDTVNDQIDENCECKGMPQEHEIEFIQCGAVIPGNSSNGISQISQYCYSDNFVNGQELIYNFTNTEISNVTIELNNLSEDLELYVFKENLLHSNCLTYSENPANESEKIQIFNLPKGEYLIVVDGYLGETSNFELSINCQSLADCNHTDSLALVALYHATNGENWINNENWLSDKPIREWYGVRLNESGCLEDLYLENNNLSGKLPPEIGDFLSLSYVCLGQNQLTGNIPPEIGNLSTLCSLKLNNNQLTGSIPPEIGKLSKLDGLQLYENELSGRIPPELGNLTTRFIWLSDNQLVGCFPEELKPLCNASIAYFGGNAGLPWNGDFDKFCTGDLQIDLICDDGDPNTENDQITEDCECKGTKVQSDCDNFAGTISFGSFNGVSNDANSLDKPIFLCHEESFTIIHNSDENLSGDPNPATPGGIGYVYYSGLPTVEGFDLNTIHLDPNIILDPSNPESFIMSLDNPSGNASFGNGDNINMEGFYMESLPNYLNNGDPIQIWFAPITVDAIGENDEVYQKIEVDFTDYCGRGCTRVEFYEGGSIVNILYNSDISTPETVTYQIPEGVIIDSFKICGLESFVSEVRLEYKDGFIFSDTINFDIVRPSDCFIPWNEGKYQLEFVNNGGLCNPFPRGGIFIGGCLMVDLPYSKEIIYEGDSTNSCISVGIEEAFSVVYLNPIEVLNINYPFGGNGCSARLWMKGGLPEFDNTEKYDIQVINNADTTIRGTIINGPVGDREFPVIEVPGKGEYSIYISDGKSCSHIETIAFEGCEIIESDLTLITGSATATVGEKVCIDVSVENFDSIIGATFFIGWDTSILAFLSVENKVEEEWIFGENLTQEGAILINFLTNDFDVGTTYPDSSTLFSLCFSGKKTGQSYISFINDPRPNSNLEHEIVSAKNDYAIIDSINTQEGVVVVLEEETSNCEIQITSDIIDATCKEQRGGIDLHVSSNFGIESIQWSNGKTTEDIVDLSPGEYFVIITDTQNCSDTSFFQVDSIPPFEVVTTIQQPCRDGINGAITINTIGGTEPFLFDYGEGFQPLETITDLPKGDYSIIIKDDSGCTAEEIVEIREATLSISLITVEHPSCTGVNDGFIQIIDEEEESGYNILWSNGNTSNLNTNLKEGTYGYTISDSNGCNFIDSIMLIAPTPMEISSTNTNPSCGGENDGVISLNVDGGIPPYNYDIGIGFGNLATFNELTGGSYPVKVRDDNGCIQEVVIELEELELILDTLNTFVIPTSCFGYSDGIIDIAIKNGSPPFLYDFNNGAGFVAVEELKNIPEGTYPITFMDSELCQGSSIFTVDRPEELQLSIESTNINCSGFKDGMAMVLAEGGVGDYIYSWNNNENTNLNINLAAGTYSVTVEDENFCEAIQEVTILEPDSIDVKFFIESMTCEENGLVNLFWDISGGISPYSYSIDGINFSSKMSIDNLESGNYEIIIRDNNLCEINQDINILPSANFTIDFPSTQITIAQGESIELMPIILDDSIIINEILWSVNGELNDGQSLSSDEFLCESIPCLNPIITPTESTIYDIIVISEDGCSAQATTEVIVADCQGEENFILTPNGDGMNEQLRLPCMEENEMVEIDENCEQCGIIIVNRWGDIVFESNTYNNDWDGRNKDGQLLPQGTYYYILRQDIGEGNIIYGNVLLLR